MSDIAIRVQNLSKRYTIARAQYRPDTLRDQIVDGVKSLFRRNGQPDLGEETIWALNDVSFEVKHGEVLGIIGRNGAGKSTLLKILSRITEPTAGRAEIFGRVGSLLEVGTGFDRELTGRENIYLNGAILGMKKAEIDRKFDEIVAFSEVEKFIDTPVKRYSSGMYVRLAFAVAAHLEPEILIVDEVLAVGDTQFQKKCLGKMGDVAKEGRTVLFVSHNMAAVGRLCTKGLLLSKGAIDFNGNTEQLIGRYLETANPYATEWRRRPPFPNRPHFRRIWLCTPDGELCSNPTSAGEFGIGIDFCLPEENDRYLMAIAILNRERQALFASSPLDCGMSLPSRPGLYSTRLLFPKGLLMPKSFSVLASLYDSGGTESYDHQPAAITFAISEVVSLANSTSTGRIGDFQILCPWQPIERSKDIP